MELKGSKTEKNLMEAFAGESQARNKYTYFASVAKKEGYQQISAIFEVCSLRFSLIQIPPICVCCGMTMNFIHARLRKR